MYATIVLLVALGFAMIMLAVWLLRNTRPDPRGARAARTDGGAEVAPRRPGVAAPPASTRCGHAVPTRWSRSSAPPATDAEFERGPQPIGFDDLVVSSTTTPPRRGAPGTSGRAVVLDGPVDADADVDTPRPTVDADEATPATPTPAGDVDDRWRAAADEDDARR